MVFFEDSVRGLSVGAPIEYRGIRIGTVTEISLALADKKQIETAGLRIPVLLRIEPARIGMPDQPASVSKVKAQIETWIEQGLKATLKTGSLLTGSLFVDLDFYPIDKLSKTEVFNQINIIPSVSGSLAQIEQKVFAILDKFEQLPIDVTVENINKMLVSANSAMATMDQTVEQLKFILANKDTQALPATLAQTLKQLNTVMQGYDSDSALY